MNSDYEVNYIKIGQQIRKYRKARGLSQEELAEKVYISIPHMSHIETGKTKLSLQVFVDLAHALRVSTDDLLGNSESESQIRVPEIIALLDSCTPKQLDLLAEALKSINTILTHYRNRQ